MLTYPGAQARVDRIYSELKAEYAIPECYTVQDEPQGDFGIAHFWGLKNGCGSISFDSGYLPQEYTIRHEIGHALSALWNEGSNAGPMHERFWIARGFNEAPNAPHTAWQAQLLAIQKDKESPNGGYRYWPEEAFADTFGVVNTPYGFPITEGYGVWLDQAKMREFYRSLGMATDDQVYQQVIKALTNFGLDANTFNFIKERLAKDAHHQHGMNGTITSEPVEK